MTSFMMFIFGNTTKEIRHSVAEDNLDRKRCGINFRAAKYTGRKVRDPLLERAVSDIVAAYR